MTVCRCRKLWTGPSARTQAGQPGISQLPQILRAQRAHAALSRDHGWPRAGDAITNATRTIRQAVRDHGWTAPQQQRLTRLRPGTWPPAAAAANPGYRGDGRTGPAIEIATSPGVIRPATGTLKRPDSHRAGPA